MERELSYDDLDPADFATMDPLLFSFPAGRDIEYLRDEQGAAVGAIIREWKALNGSVEIRSLNCHDDVVRITVQVDNLTGSDPANAVRIRIARDNAISIRSFPPTPFSAPRTESSFPCSTLPRASRKK